MAEFDTAIAVVLVHEGAKGKLAGDPGGETSFGWTAEQCKQL